MATQKPISTISYNSEAFLREKLEMWLNAHKIQAYQYICHKGEDGDKDHIHVRVEPNMKLDPMNLQEDLREFQAGKDKPLGCRPFRPSKEEDWILYAVHDSQYLSLKYGGGDKGEKIPYQWQDIRVPDNYDMEIAFIRAKSSLAHTSVNMATRIQSGDNPMKLILEGENPYIVNALMRAVSQTDYQRISAECLELRQEVKQLTEAIENYGLVILADDKGKLYLSSQNKGSADRSENPVIIEKTDLAGSPVDVVTGTGEIVEWSEPGPDDEIPW